MDGLTTQLDTGVMVRAPAASTVGCAKSPRDTVEPGTASGAILRTRPATRAASARCVRQAARLSGQQAKPKRISRLQFSGADIATSTARLQYWQNLRPKLYSSELSKSLAEAVSEVRTAHASETD